MDAFIVRSKRKHGADKSPQDEVEGKKSPQDEVEGKKSPQDEVGGNMSPQDEVENMKSPQDEVENMKSPQDEVESNKKLKTDALSFLCTRPNITWEKITAENLDCDYCILYNRHETKKLLDVCEKEIEYNTGQLAKVRVFGQWHDIARKRVAYGDSGLSYHFSGTNVPAQPWPDFIKKIRDQISSITGHVFNFVLVNRYKDGNDHIGEHRDDEKDLVAESPIASLTLGQARDFVFKHSASRGKAASRKIPTVTKELQSGSLMLMNYPTNRFWHHSLPKRKNALGVRINMTFRDFKKTKA